MTFTITTNELMIYVSFIVIVQSLVFVILANLNTKWALRLVVIMLVAALVFVRSIMYG